MNENCVVGVIGSGLESIPTQIGLLTALDSFFALRKFHLILALTICLNLYNNALTTIPTEIGQLTSLTFFYLHK